MSAVAQETPSIPEFAARILSKPKRLLINGKWVDAASGKTFPVIDPATGQDIGQAAEGDKTDVDAAVKEFRARGVRFLQPPQMIQRDQAGDFGKRGGEEWMAFFNDPAGNLLALVERR